MASSFQADQRAVVFEGDCADFMREIPDKAIQLIVTIGIGNAIDTFSANGSVKRITFPEQPMRSREIDRQLLYLG